MRDTVTLNVSFKLKVPVEYDELGRRIHPGRTAARYIDDYFLDLRILQADPNILHQAETPEDRESYGVIATIAQAHFNDEKARSLRLYESQKRRWEEADKKLKERQDNYMEMLGMTEEEFRAVSGEARKQLLDTKGVKFDWVNNLWVKTGSDA